MKIPADDIVFEIISRHLAGQSSDEDKAVIDSWRGLSDENEQHFQEMTSVWSMTSEASPGIIPTMDIDEEWNTQLQFIQAETANGVLESDNVVSINTTKTNGVWYRVAAAAIILIAAGVLFVNYSNILGETYYAEAQGDVIEFKDGSLITMNTDSKIKHAGSFNKRDRIVEFEGEAFFEVEPDPNKPFIIKTKAAEIRVVGTSFNVRALPYEDFVEVTVVSGEVLLSDSDRKENVALKANDTGMFDCDSGKIEKIEAVDPNFLAWQTGKIIFDNADLKNVVKTLNSAYGKNAINLDPQLEEGCSLTVSFENQTIESVIKVLESTLQLDYEVDENGVITIIDTGC